MSEVRQLYSVCSVNKQHQQHLGVCQKCKFQTQPRPIDSDFWDWGPEMCVAISFLGVSRCSRKFVKHVAKMRWLWDLCEVATTPCCDLGQVRGLMKERKNCSLKALCHTWVSRRHRRGNTGGAIYRPCHSWCHGHLLLGTLVSPKTCV